MPTLTYVYKKNRLTQVLLGEIPSLTMKSYWKHLNTIPRPMILWNLLPPSVFPTEYDMVGTFLKRAYASLRDNKRSATLRYR